MNGKPGIGFVLAMAVTMAVGFAGGCDSASDGGCPTCADACRHIYQTCGKSVLDNDGAQMTQAQCNTACTGTTDGALVSDCVVKVKDCGDAALLACIQNPPESTCGGTGTQKPAHDVSRGGVNHASGSGTPSSPGSCATCHDGTKAPACSDCH